VWAVVEDSMMLRMLCVAIAAGLKLGLGGCWHGKYIELRQATAEELKTRTDEELLWAAGIAARRSTQDETIINELASRHEWSEEDADRVRNRKIYTGYSREMLVASWGWPDSVSEVVSAFGRRQTYRYSWTSVFLNNGERVSGWVSY